MRDASGVYNRVWSKKEEDAIRRYYPAHKKEKLVSVLKDRNWGSICQRATTIGVKCLSLTPTKARHVVRSMSDITGAYLAGLVDGEGYIGVVRTRTPPPQSKRGFRFHTLMTVTNTNPGILRWIRKSTGVGSVHIVPSKSPRNRDHGTWMATSHDARQVLEVIRKYLRIKQQQADILIAFMKSRRVHVKAGMSSADFRFQERLWLRMKFLNRKGPR